MIERQAAKTFLDLLVWQRAHAFVLAIYKRTAAFPNREAYGLASQMRAAVSIPANIAEGFVKRGKADKARFFNIAEGSLEESRYYLILSQDLGYGNTGELMELLNEVGRLLKGYSRAILAS
ncbi:MAG TPA: four helix bundle protein [Terriglobia bacterium]|nr:four helix bundle protein [Terriglobia bacterium]